MMVQRGAVCAQARNKVQESAVSRCPVDARQRISLAYWLSARFVAVRRFQLGQWRSSHPRTAFARPPALASYQRVKLQPPKPYLELCAVWRASQAEGNHGTD